MNYLGGKHPYYNGKNKRDSEKILLLCLAGLVIWAVVVVVANLLGLVH